MITELRKAYDKMPIPDRLLRRRTPAEHETAEKARISKLGRALGKGRGPKPTESVEELQRPVSQSKVLRHTYTTARIQTIDNGRPISLWTVAQELGHASTKMVQKVYAHLGRVRHRGEEVEYRW